MRKLFNIRFVTCGIVGLLTLAIMFQGPALMAEEGDAIAIAKVEHDGPVDFEKEILPIFRRNCLACHNATDAESDLVLETPQTISKGGARETLKCMRTGKDGISSGTDGLKALDLIFTIYRSAELKGNPTRINKQ